MKPIIYIDMLFLLNLLMDSIITYSTALFLKKFLPIWHIILVSSIAALYSTVMFFPQLSFMFSGLAKVVFLFAMSYIAFPSKVPVTILKNCLVYFCINGIFGGIMFALIFATDFGKAIGAAVSNGEIYLSVSFEILLISTLLAYTIIYVISYIKRQNIQAAKLTAKLTIHFFNKHVTLSALCDTGCTLCDPISGAPAVIISPKTAQELLPQELINGNINILGARYRSLPFATIDNARGILDGFIPDKLIIDNNEITYAVVGISKNDIEKYSAIFNPNLIYKKTQRKAVNSCELSDTVA